jgi:CHASE3 domain sensor protein
MNLPRKIDALFLIAILIFAGLFYASFQSSRFTRESSRLVTQANEILYHLERVESAISGIEGAHRGFLIAGNEEFLDRVDYEKKEIRHGIEVIDSLIGEDQEQLARLDELCHLIDRKIHFSEQGVALRREGNIDLAWSLVSSGKGKQVMDSIRMLGKTMEREEINALNDKTNHNEELVVAQNRDFLFFSGFILLLLFGFYIRIRKNTKKLLSYQQKQDELIRELNYQNRQLDDFAHLTSHNIRSPAVNIYTLISLLDEHSSLEDYKLIYGKLTKVSKNLNETLNELIEVLQVKNNTNIERELLSFEAVFNKVKDSMQGDILLSQALISSNFEEAPCIKYPKTYLESIFHNFLSNAIKYRSPQRTPEIAVSTQKLDGQIVLEVSDNGLGIDMERYGNQIFGLRKTFHRNMDAKGIGLFMTKTQIEALGGKISVRSEKDSGTTFRIVFGVKGNVAPLEETSLNDRVSIS